MTDRVMINDLRVNCIVGLNPWERRTSQELRISISLTVDLSLSSVSGRLIDTIDYGSLAEEAATIAIRGRYELLESLAEALTDACLQRLGVQRARVSIQKPAAIRNASAAVVEMTRSRERPEPRLLGVLNVSSESRVSTSVATDEDQILKRATKLRDEGCKLIEIGARSTNPSMGTKNLSEAEEIERLRPALKALLSYGFHIAVETWSTKTALWAIDAGASMINFTSTEPADDLCRSAGQHGTSLVLVHLPYFNPEEMHRSNPTYDSIDQIAETLSARADAARTAGADEIYLDPNTGIMHPKLDDFFKVELQMRAMDAARLLENRSYPVLINCPRKESLTSRIILSHLLLETRPTWIRTHDPEIVASVRRLQQMDSSYTEEPNS